MGESLRVLAPKAIQAPASQQPLPRSGSQETPGAAVAVDGELHGAQEVGGVLHFVQRERFASARERRRVTACGVEHVMFVEPSRRSSGIGRSASWC
jgi:hypothetical protein